MANVHITPPPLSAQSMADLLCTVILLCRGVGTDKKPFWAYMCIKPSMAESFKEARNKGVFQLENYGTIIELGEGDEVPSEIKQRMERDYGVNHHFEEDLMAAIKSLEHDKL